MTLFSERSLLRLALVGVLAVSFGLAGCGRKGPLDPPPSAAADAPPAEARQQSVNPMSMQPLGSPTQGGGDMLTTPPGPKKRIFLDNLLN